MAPPKTKPVHEDEEASASAQADLQTILAAITALGTRVAALEQPKPAHQASRPTYVPLLNTSAPPQQVPRFGNDDVIHPVDFVDTMEHHLTAMDIKPEEWIRHAISNMTGMVHDWGKSFFHTWEDWSSFRHAFLDMFWSEDRQERLMEEMRTTIFVRARDKSLTSFFITWMAKTRHLTPPMSSRTFIRRMASLLPANVEMAIYSAKISSEQEMLTFLRDLDDAAARRQDRARSEAGT